MDKDVMDMYAEMVQQMNPHPYQFSGMDYRKERGYAHRNDNYFNPDDEEVFITSKEIAEMHMKETKAEDEATTIWDKPKRTQEHPHFKRFTKRREHKYTEKEMEAIRESCRTTIVHDYGPNDAYHFSDEELEKQNRLFKMRDRLSKVRRIYRRLDHYVIAMRTVMDAWEELRKDDYVHDKDTFYRLVAEGVITSPAIIMPKLVGSKRVNMENLIKYISNPDMDVSNLAPKKESYDYFDIDDTKEDGGINQYLSKEEIEYIKDFHEGKAEPMRVKSIPAKYVVGYDKRFGDIYSGKKKKKLTKKQKRARDSFHKTLNMIQDYVNKTSVGGMYSYTNSIFEPKERNDSWDKYRYHGSFADKAGMKMYEIWLSIQMLDEPDPVNRFSSGWDVRTNEMFEALENAGVDTMKMRKNIAKHSNGGRSEKAIASYDKKRQRKLERGVMNRLNKINNDPKSKKRIKEIEKRFNNYTERGRLD